MPTVGVVQYPVPAPPGPPRELARGPDGDLWFTDDRGIGRLRHDGTVEGFALPAGYIAPLAIVPGPGGAAWFTDLTSGGDVAIGRVGTDGRIDEFPTDAPGYTPHGIAAGPDGNVWFTGYHDGDGFIGRMTPSGSFTRFPLSKKNSLPEGIVAGADGNLWFTQELAGTVGRITPDGTITEFPIPSGRGGSSIAAGPDGNVWFTETGPAGVIGRATPQGQVSEFRTSGGDTGLGAITAGTDGALWFTAQGRGASRIGRMSVKGAVTEYPIPASGWAPVSIVAGPGGDLSFPLTNAIGQLRLHAADAPLKASGVAHATATEGRPFSGVVARFVDADRHGVVGDYRATLTWDDGQTVDGVVVADGHGGFTVSDNGEVLESGRRRVTVTIFDVKVDRGVGGAMATAVSTINVADAPLSATARPVAATSGHLFRGQVATLSDAAGPYLIHATQGVLPEYRVTIDWGDRTPASRGLVLAPPKRPGTPTPSAPTPGPSVSSRSVAAPSAIFTTFEVDGAHLYAAPGRYRVRITIKDLRGGSQVTVTTTATVG